MINTSSFYTYDANYLNTYCENFISELRTLINIEEDKTIELFKEINRLNISMYNINCYRGNHILILNNTNYENELINLAKMNANIFVSRVGNFWSLIETIIKPDITNKTSKSFKRDETKTGDNTINDTFENHNNSMSENAPIDAIDANITTPTFKAKNNGNGTTNSQRIIDENNVEESDENIINENAINREITLRTLKEYGIASIIEDIFNKITYEHILIY